MQPNNNQAVGGTVGGGALAFIIVWALPQLTTLEVAATEASGLTVAFAGLVGFLVRYLPRPRS